jgi:hypothetical protein
MILDRFPSGRILVESLSNIFLDFLFYNAKENMYTWNKFFYATMVNTPTSFYTPLIYSHGA